METGPEQYEADNAEEERTDEREPAHYAEEKRKGKAQKNRENLYVRVQLEEREISPTAAIRRASKEAGAGTSVTCLTLGLRNAEIEPMIGGKLTIACARPIMVVWKAVVGWS